MYIIDLENSRLAWARTEASFEQPSSFPYPANSRRIFRFRGAPHACGDHSTRGLEPAAGLLRVALAHR